MNIAEVRAKYPQYNDLSDEQLTRALHAKFYSDMSYQSFAAKLNAKQETPQPNVADEYGPVQAAVIAAGRTLDRLGKGVKQAGLTIASPVSEEARVELARMAKAEDENTRLFGQLEAKHPISTALGGAAPLLAAPVLGGGAIGMAGSAAIPGLIEYGTPTEKLTRGGLGAAGGLAGAALGKLASRAAQPVRQIADPARAEAIAAAERIGYQVPIGQRTGSRALQAIEQQLAKNPVTAGAAQRINQSNQESVNAAVARSMGERATSLTDNVIDAAKARVGAAFDDITGRTKINVGGDELVDALVQLDIAQKGLGSFADPQIASLIDKGLDLAAKGQVEGKTYQVIRSTLGKRAESAFNGGNSELGGALKAVQRSLDDAANNSISAGDRAAWGTARRQWQAIKIASKRMGVIEGGNVSPARLSSRVDKARGSVPQELADVAKIGETFKPLPDSGTASNALTQMLISGGAGLLGPVPLATTLGVPMAAQKFITSKAGQAYLSKGLMPMTPEIERMLMLMGAGSGTAATGLLGSQ